MAFRVLHDDKSLNVWTTRDKIACALWADYTGQQSLTQLTLYGEDGAKIATAKELEGPVSILKFLRPRPHYMDKDISVPVYFMSDATPGSITLEAITHAKFPRVHYDEGTNRVHMFYWSNIALAETKEVATSGGTSTSTKVFNSGEEPPVEPVDFETGILNEFAQRVLMYTEGTPYLVRQGSSSGTLELWYFFQKPFRVHRGTTLNPDPGDPPEDGEPVLDVHIGGTELLFCKVLSGTNPYTVVEVRRKRTSDDEPIATGASDSDKTPGNAFEAVPGADSIVNVYNPYEKEGKGILGQRVTIDLTTSTEATIPDFVWVGKDVKGVQVVAINPFANYGDPLNA